MTPGERTSESGECIDLIFCSESKYPDYKACTSTMNVLIGQD